MADDARADLQMLTADIVAAYVSNNKVSGDELPTLISSTFQALSSAAAPAPAEPELPTPDKAAIKKSLGTDHITSFVDGRKYKSLKRHLKSQGLSPDEYRTRYGLPKDYPMVAPSYSAQRSQLAKSLGLGRKAATASETPPVEPPKPEVKASEANAPRARKAKSKAAKAEDEAVA